MIDLNIYELHKKELCEILIKSEIILMNIDLSILDVRQNDLNALFSLIIRELDIKGRDSRTFRDNSSINARTDLIENDVHELEHC